MNNQYFSSKQPQNNEFTLTPKERATFKRALIQNGQQTAGLSDAELQKRYNALVGEPLHAVAPVSGAETAPVAPVSGAKPRKTPKPKPAPQDKKAQLMAIFDELMAGNDDGPMGISEAQIQEMIERQIARTKFVTITLPLNTYHAILRFRSNAIDNLAQASFHCADESEHDKLFDDFRAYLASLDAQIHPQQ